MAKKTRLDGERLRELARIGAEVTLRRASCRGRCDRARLSGVEASHATPADASSAGAGVDQNADDVSGSAARG